MQQKQVTKPSTSNSGTFWDSENLFSREGYSITTKSSNHTSQTITKASASQTPATPPSPNLGRMSSEKTISYIVAKESNQSPQTPGPPPSPKLERLSSVERTTPMQQKQLTKAKASQTPGTPPSQTLGPPPSPN